MFNISIAGDRRGINYDCEEIATLVYNHLILLYPTLHVSLTEELFHEALVVIKETNALKRIYNPYKRDYLKRSL